MFFTGDSSFTLHTLSFLEAHTAEQNKATEPAERIFRLLFQDSLIQLTFHLYNLCIYVYIYIHIYFIHVTCPIPHVHVSVPFYSFVLQRFFISSRISGSRPEKGLDLMASMEEMAPIASNGAGDTIPLPKISQKEMRQEGIMQLSDVEGFAQLLFHMSFLAMCAMLVTFAYDRGYWGLLLVAEIPFGIAESFLFNGFHEMVHNTAFETKAFNTIFAHFLGFENFRGAKWFWCFHWTHHRFTNDPSKDPELSGESVDLDDPTKSLTGYLQFISGYPFGFERVVRMARIVCYNEVDPWVVDKPETTQKVVRMEAACYLLGYVCVLLASLIRPVVGVKVFLLWILPHCIGAGHLRLYQFAEHRACKMGPYTDA